MQRDWVSCMQGSWIPCNIITTPVKKVNGKGLTLHLLGGKLVGIRFGNWQKLRKTIYTASYFPFQRQESLQTVASLEILGHMSLRCSRNICPSLALEPGYQGPTFSGMMSGNEGRCSKQIFGLHISKDFFSCNILRPMILFPLAHGLRHQVVTCLSPGLRTRSFGLKVSAISKSYNWCAGV